MKLHSLIKEPPADGRYIFIVRDDKTFEGYVGVFKNNVVVGYDEEDNPIMGVSIYQESVNDEEWGTSYFSYEEAPGEDAFSKLDYMIYASLDEWEKETGVVE